jgi:hypothetical protein
MLFSRPVSVLNVGITSFADAIRSRGGAATQLDWAPPAAGDRAAGEALARLVNEPKIEAANAQAVERYLAAQPKVTGIGVAREALPGMKERMILHAGPPVPWSRAITTPRSGRWPASSARRCRCGSWRIPRTATAPSATSTRVWARCCASARTAPKS